MGAKSILFRNFLLLIRSSSKFVIKYSLEWQKKCVVNEPFIFNTLKVIEFEIEFWPISKLKIGQNFNFKLNNFLYMKDERFVDPTFFLSFQALLYVRFWWRSVG